MIDAFFNYPIQYDTGDLPSAGVNGETVVEVHQSQATQTLWYHVGNLGGSLVGFGPSYQYDSGINPAVAIDQASTVVEVHQSADSSTLYYRVGAADLVGKKIDFGSNTQYDSGSLPKVALNNSNVVVEVHEATAPSTNLWYNVGTVDPTGTSISFVGPVKYGEGAFPAIALDDLGTVVEIHQSEGSAVLQYTVGVLSHNGISFGNTQVFGNGYHPSIAINDNDFVIVVYRSGVNYLIRRIGKVNAVSKMINWLGQVEVYSTEGTAPAVACAGPYAIEVHERDGSLLYAASAFIDRTSWMADNLETIGEESLTTIAMPASHDAGMSRSVDCRGASACNTRTQEHFILRQLAMGSRYFDLRPVLFNNTMYTGHYTKAKVLGVLGCNGASMAQVLDGVRAYLESTTWSSGPMRGLGGKDLVILKFSHYFDRDSNGGGFSETQMQQLLDQVTQVLQPWLFITQQVPEGGLQSLTVNDYIGSGGKVLAVFEGLSETLKSNYQGVYSYANKGQPGDLVVYDNYADTNDVNTMISDQVGKLTNANNHEGNLFLLSWTLTQSTTQAVLCSAGLELSIRELAQKANRMLWPTLAPLLGNKINKQQMTNLIYTDDVLGVQTDFAIWLNKQIRG